MNFFSALRVISDLSTWVMTGNFLTKVAKHRNELQRGLPRLYKSTLPKNLNMLSGLKYKIETREATEADRKSLLETFSEKLIAQFEALKDFDFKIKIKDFLSILNMNYNGLKSVAELIPNLIPFIISKLDFGNLDDLVVISDIKQISEKVMLHNQEVRRKKNSRFGFGNAFAFQDDDEDEGEELSLEQELIVYYFKAENKYSISPALRELVRYELVLKVAHKLFNRLFERISYFARIQAKHISEILGRDVLRVLVADVYSSFVSKYHQT